MHRRQFLVALLLSVFISTTLSAESIIAEVIAVNPLQGVLILEDKKYYVTLKSRNSGDYGLALASLKPGMLVAVDYQVTSSKRRKIIVIKVPVH
ncbi:MAG: hypothetical protein HRU05_04365 [Oceanospirillaceae bacterium]|nr:hypothetical protein [Oceanospirillaceae bacterium]